jgi:putative transposase
VDRINQVWSADISYIRFQAGFVDLVAVMDWFSRYVQYGDGRRRVLDNVFVERLWRSVKYEEVYLRDYHTVWDARQGLGRYFAFYTGERLLQALGYLPPAAVYHG